MTLFFNDKPVGLYHCGNRQGIFEDLLGYYAAAAPDKRYPTTPYPDRSVDIDSCSSAWSYCLSAPGIRYAQPGEIYTDAEVEGKAYLYADDDYEGIEYDTRDVAENEELYVYGGF